MHTYAGVMFPRSAAGGKLQKFRPHSIQSKTVPENKKTKSDSIFSVSPLIKCDTLAKRTGK